ncbi:hypothetical protein HQ590_01640, partial [bacterium]|nr:hypothetical protein [bacterium]
MNTTRRMISLGAMVLLGGLAAGPAGRSAVAAAPSSTAAVAVVTLDYRGDAMARRGRDVSLEVFADGRIHFGNPFGTTQPLDTQLSPEQLEALLEFILVDQGFRQFDPEALRQELATAAANDPPKVTRLMDARTMVRIPGE